MTVRYENNRLVNLLSHNIVKTRNNINKEPWNEIYCSTCHHIFDDGEDRHEWRMHLPFGKDGVKYRNGSFKSVDCHECFQNNMIIWQRSITEAIELPMRVIE